jgi:hypothetical protein
MARILLMVLGVDSGARRVRFFEAPDGHNEPTVFVEWEDIYRQVQTPIIQRCKVDAEVREWAWPHIVRALTAGPTLESARVVIDTLREENQALLRANAELNDELSALRRVGA